MAIEADALNPAQQDVLDLLGARPDERPQFDAELRHELRALLEEGMAEAVGALPDGDDLFVSKHHLSRVHGCERRYLSEREDPFAWSASLARGSVTHKAIELAVNWRGEPNPTELVDEAVARLTDGVTSLGDWLATRTDADLSEVRAAAHERVAAFLECFPPLQARWRPVTETGLRIELADGRVILSGRVDLTLGHASGTTAGKVLIDLKTGAFSPTHVDDLRFYALLDTLRVGTPPRLVASYYLDAGRAHPEVVTTALLEAAARRTVAGATRIVELVADGRPPTAVAGPGCRWCAERPDCDTGRQHLERVELEG